MSGFTVNADVTGAVIAYTVIANELLKRWLATNPDAGEVADFTAVVRHAVMNTHSDNTASDDVELLLVELARKHLDAFLERQLRV